MGGYLPWYKYCFGFFFFKTLNVVRLHQETNALICLLCIFMLTSSTLNKAYRRVLVITQAEHCKVSWMIDIECVGCLMINNDTLPVDNAFVCNSMNSVSVHMNASVSKIRLHVCMRVVFVFWFSRHDFMVGKRVVVPSVSSALCLGDCWKGVGFTRTPWLWKAVIGGNIVALACRLWSRSSTARSRPEPSDWLLPSLRTGPSRTHTWRWAAYLGWRTDRTPEWHTRTQTPECIDLQAGRELLRWRRCGSWWPGCCLPP